MEAIFGSEVAVLGLLFGVSINRIRDWDGGGSVLAAIKGRDYSER